MAVDHQKSDGASRPPHHSPARSMAAVAPEPPSPEHAHVHFSADTGQPAERTDKHEQLMRRYGSAEASNETEAFFSRAWDAVTRSTNALTVGGDKKAENGDDDNTIMKFLAETTKAMRGGLNKLRGARRILSIPALRAGLSAEQRMERAALFVCDAQNQRYAHGLGVAYQDSRVKFRLLQMRDSKLYSFVMYMVIVLYCILGAMALPPEHRPGGRAPNRWPHDTQLALNVLNVACAALVLADSLLRAYVWGALTGTLTDASSIFPIALNCLLLADTLVAVIDNHRGWPVVRACRALLLFRSHILKTLMITLLATVPAALLIGVFIFTLMLLYSILAIQFYAGAYSGPDNFDRIGAALRTFFVLLYTDNYPSVVNSAANRHGYFAWLFFMSFLVAGTIVSFNVVLSIMVPLYKENHTKTAVAAKILERKALTAAFGLLEDGTGVVTRMQWRRLVPLVEHGISAKRIEMLFDLADQDGSGEINIVEFFEIVTTLSHPAELEKLDPVTHVFFIPQWLQERAKQVITNRYVRRAIAMLLVANTIVFCLYGTVSDTRGLTRAWRVFLGIFSAEVCLKIMAAPRLFWTDNWCVFDFVAVLVLGLGAQIAYAIVLRVDASDNVTDIVRRFASGAGAIRLFRLLDMIPPFRALTHTLLRVVFTLGRFVAIFLIIFYVFAVIGQDLFAYKFCNSDGECMRWSNLDTVWNGTLLLFQVLLLAGWSDFMYARRCVRSGGG